MAQQTLSADGQTPALDLPLSRSGTQTTVATRTYHAAAYGTFGGGTAKLQWSGDGGSTWIDTGVSFTSDGETTVDLGPGKVRWDLSGSTSPSLTLDLNG